MSYQNEDIEAIIASVDQLTPNRQFSDTSARLLNGYGKILTLSSRVGKTLSNPILPLVDDCNREIGTAILEVDRHCINCHFSLDYATPERLNIQNRDKMYLHLLSTPRGRGPVRAKAVMLSASRPMDPNIPPVSEG